MVFFEDYVSSPKIWAFNLSRKRWDLWEGISNYKSSIQGKDGEVLVGSDNYINQYNRNTSEYRDLKWESKEYTMGVDTQKKVFHSIGWTGNLNTPPSAYIAWVAPK